MSRLSANPFLIIIFGLAALGLGYQLVTNPLGLLTYLVVGTAVAVGIYLLFTKVILKRMTMNQYQKARPRPAAGKAHPSKAKNKYYKAVKQQQSKNKPLKKRPSKGLNKRRSDHNLTVIEGKKNRKRNRALF